MVQMYEGERAKIRASDTDRDHVVEHLNAAYGLGLAGSLPADL